MADFRAPVWAAGPEQAGFGGKGSCRANLLMPLGVTGAAPEKFITQDQLWGAMTSVREGVPVSISLRNGLQPHRTLLWVLISMHPSVSFRIAFRTSPHNRFNFEKCNTFLKQTATFVSSEVYFHELIICFLYKEQPFKARSRPSRLVRSD